MNKIITAVLVSALFMSCKRDLPFEELSTQKKPGKIKGAANSFTATITTGGRTVTMSDYSIYDASTNEYKYFSPDGSSAQPAVSFKYRHDYVPGSLQAAPFNEITLYSHASGDNIKFHIRTDATGNYQDYALIDDSTDGIDAIAYMGYGPYPNAANITYTITKTKKGDAVNGNFVITGMDNYTTEPFTITGSFVNIVKLAPYPPFGNSINTSYELEFQTIRNTYKP